MPTIYSSIIFDLDGTLVDSIQDIGEAMNRVLGRYNLPKHNMSSYRAMVGWGVKELVRNAIPAAYRNNADFVETCIHEMKKEYYDTPIHHTAPYPGISDFLEKLQKRECSISVFSNKPNTITKHVVHTLFPNIHFDAIRGHKDGVAPKPNAEGALLLAEEIGVKPSTCVLVGDSEVDYQTAHNAGMDFIAISWGFRDKGYLIKHGITKIIDSVKELELLLI